MMAKMYWCEVKVELPADVAEVAAEIFQEEGAGGVVFDDPEILNQVDLGDDEFIGREFRESLPERFGLRVYFVVDDRLGERLDRCRERLGKQLGLEREFGLKQIREEEWADSWKQYFKPEQIGTVVIKPSWEEYHPQPGEQVVELDPGMAFGTGTHPTTRLCVELLQELIDRPLRVLDLGTGSGILAVVAVKLGAATVTATDIDPVAVRIAADNARINGVAGQVRTMEADLLGVDLPEPFDLVVANIIANAILKVVPGVPRVLKPGGIFLCSGIIEERFPEVQAELERQGFQIERVLRRDGWVAAVGRNGTVAGGCRP